MMVDKVSVLCHDMEVTQCDVSCVCLYLKTARSVRKRWRVNSCNTKVVGRLLIFWPSNYCYWLVRLHEVWVHDFSLVCCPFPVEICLNPIELSSSGFVQVSWIISNQRSEIWSSDTRTVFTSCICSNHVNEILSKRRESAHWRIGFRCLFTKHEHQVHLDHNRHPYRLTLTPSPGLIFTEQRL